MSSTPTSHLFRAYLPLWLRDRVDRGAIQPGDAYSLHAAVLYADLTGFTQLAVAFASIPDGAERLHEALSYCFEALINTVLAHDGDILAIAGDALTAWWPEQRDPAAAVRCANAMHAAIDALPLIATPSGPFRLDLRIGISAGIVHTVLAGQTSHGLYLVAFGPAITAATQAERQTVPGTLHVAITPQSELPAQSDRRSPGPQLRYEDFLAPAFVERLRLNTLVPEYRRCVPVFCAFQLPANPADLHRLAAQLQSVVARWGGWLNEIEIGDKGAVFVLLFGAPLARGDDASRAVGCALELRERGLIERAAISAGFVFVGPVGSPQRRVYTAQGEDMNLAAHLMEQAEPGDILVSGRTRSEIMGRYHTSPPWPVVTKGHSEGVPVARVLSSIQSGNPALQRFLPGAIDLIGRNEVRRQALDVAQAAIGGQARLMLIEGESGIGKSMLLQHVMAYWRSHDRRGVAGECASGSQTRLWQPWQPILRDLCSIDESVGSHAQAQQLRVFVQALGLPPRDQEALAAILEMQADEQPPKAQLAAAMIRLIRAMLRRGPLLIVIEDAHWADDHSLALIESLLNATPSIGPLCLAISYRPLDASTPLRLSTLAAHPAAEQLTLGPLGPHDTETFIRALLGVQHLDPELARYIERQTQGQPLFIREYLRILRQQGMIRIEDNAARLSATPGAAQLSSSAQGIVQAQVDRLDEPTRLTLKIAAVIGRSFPLRLLATIHPTQPDPDELTGQLQQLAALRIINLELGDPERVYRFSYGIAHEVAYTSLLFGQRRRLHAAVARWYEAEYAQELADGKVPLAVYDLLIGHLRRSEDWAAAVDYCRKAGERAAQLTAYTAAIRYLDQAVELAPTADARLIPLLMRIAINEQWGSYSSQQEDLTEAQRLAETLGTPTDQAWVLFFRLRFWLSANQPDAVLSVIGDFDQLLGQLDAAEPLRKLLHASRFTLEAEAHQRRGAGPAARVLWRQSLGLARRAEPAAHAQFVGMSASALLARSLHGLAELSTGERSAAIARRQYAAAQSAAHRSGDWCAEHRAQIGLVDLLIMEGQYGEALGLAGSVLGDSRAINDRRSQAAALRRLARIRAAQGDSADAQRIGWHALAISTLAQDRLAEVAALADLADFAELQGHVDEAGALRKEAGLPHKD